MRAVDLLGATVIDTDGVEVGIVHDLYLHRGGPAVHDSGQPAYRIAALECGPAGFAHRLGYGHRDLAGPWPINTVLGRMVHRSRLVDWDHIATINNRRIVLDVPADALPHVGDEQ
ncbi:MAG TPA: PRC-barrel domain-containing protein [Micromonosporaceae bacterium]|jgi:hypothetical protein